MDSLQNQNVSQELPSNRRLNSWKAIGAFFERDERTVRRWEIERGLPVHRMPGSGRSSVYAYTHELTEWLKTADVLESDGEPRDESVAPMPVRDESPPSAEPRPGGSNKLWIPLFVCIGVLVLAIAPAAYWRYFSSPKAPAINASPGLRAAANREAQEFYLQGLYHWNKRTPEDLRNAVDDFTQAIVHDPNYAPAYVGLANCYNLLREYTQMPADEAYPRAIAAAQRAISLDDSLAEAHNSLAFADFYWSWDVTGAEREFQRAIALDPNSVVAHHWYATFLMVLGRFDESLAEIEKARDLDPHSSAILADKGLILFLAGHKEEAVLLLRQLESSDPDFLSPHSYLAVIGLATSDYPTYLPESRRCAQLLHDPDHLTIAEAAERGFAAAGATGMLRAMLRAQQNLYATGRVNAYELAATYCLLGNRQQALHLLQVSVQRHEPNDVAMRVDRDFESLHADPAFQKLVTQVGLPPLS